jgi:hypothetical protein
MGHYPHRNALDPFYRSSGFPNGLVNGHMSTLGSMQTADPKKNAMSETLFQTIQGLFFMRSSSRESFAGVRHSSEYLYVSDKDATTSEIARSEGLEY